MSSSVSDVPRLSQDGTGAPLQAPTEPVAEELPPALAANNGISSATPTELPGFESVPRPVSAPSPVSLPTFVNGCQPHSMRQPSQDFDGDIIGDDLDKLLEQAEPESAMVSTEDIWGGSLSHISGECPCVIKGLAFVSGYTHDEGAPPTADQYCLGRFHAELLPDALPHQLVFLQQQQ